MRSYLSEVENSGRFIIENICPKSGIYSQLIGQGLYNGKEFEVLAITSGKYILKLDNSKITLDKSFAEHIRVIKCGKTCLWNKFSMKFGKKNKNCNSECKAKKNSNALIIEENNIPYVMKKSNNLNI